MCVRETTPGIGMGCHLSHVRRFLHLGRFLNLEHVEKLVRGSFATLLRGGGVQRNIIAQGKQAVDFVEIFRVRRLLRLVD